VCEFLMLKPPVRGGILINRRVNKRTLACRADLK
jgi:hypothetical protein